METYLNCYNNVHEFDIDPEGIYCRLDIDELDAIKLEETTPGNLKIALTATGKC